MSDHYYTQDPSADHDVAKWNFTLAGKDFLFTTDSGVFSKKTVDFGSRLLIEQFNYRDLPAGAVLDVGCGYGPIGLSLAHLMPNRVVEMVDVNQRAVDLAKLNSKNNQIENVKIHTSNIYETVSYEQYAAIVSNPPIRAGKQVVHQILSDAYSRLLPTGTLTIVIQKKQGAPSAEKKMVEVFGNVKVTAKKKGYYILTSKKSLV